MRQPVNEVVHAELEGFVRGSGGVPTSSRVLHVVADVHVVVDDDHQPVGRIIPLMDPVELTHQAVLAQAARIRHIERLDREEGVEHGM